MNLLMHKCACSTLIWFDYAWIGLNWCGQWNDIAFISLGICNLSILGKLNIPSGKSIHILVHFVIVPHNK